MANDYFTTYDHLTTHDHFTIHDHQLFCEEVPLLTIAEKVGTPCYVYSKTHLKTAWQSFNSAFQENKNSSKFSKFKNLSYQINYAVKANDNLAVLNTFAELGSGFDIVSIGELYRVIKAKGDIKKTIFSGVGKTASEIKEALKLGVYCFNVESEQELTIIEKIAKELSLNANIAFRVNPNVDPKSHPFISTGKDHHKFGIPIDALQPLCTKVMQSKVLTLQGLSMHIGSQITDLNPFIQAIDKLLYVTDSLKASQIPILSLNLGGGLGIRYHTETPPSPKAYVDMICHRMHNQPVHIHIEPGRALVGNAGVLLTEVTYLKNAFAIVDAGMNDLIRPALYNAWHDIIPVKQKPQIPARLYDVVGPVCETSDTLGQRRMLAIEQNDILAIKSAGAYGFTMSSNYNARPRPAEVICEGKNFYVSRPRERLEDLYRNEVI